MDAESLHCPSCGAPARSDASTCSHCGGVLATVACPKCFHLMFRDSKFCSSCGALAVAWRGEPGNLSCPECEQSMLKGEVASCLLHHCAKCYGIWLDKETFARVCRDADQQSAVLGLPQLMGAESAAPEVEIRYRKCPQCPERMNRVNFARCSGVVVDVCRTHGTWFDRQELHRIIQFVQRGGLEKSRALELENLEHERRRASQALGDSPPSYTPMCGGCPTADLAEIVVYTAVRAAAAILTDW
ncbi:MAG: zf-TFIIB domain-containing protein [Verrucomicrobia bacterium]|nr:zf-TFIIB domain-containing protein [Verrucomicrobiota bacterium]MBI3867343.1 zf-TFIIB domain-containing protein [Verrucomicrobiota bacterium]